MIYICFYRTAQYCIWMVPKLFQDCITRCGLNAEKLCAGVEPERNNLYHIIPATGNKMVKFVQFVSETEPFSDNYRTQLKITNTR